MRKLTLIIPILILYAIPAQASINIAFPASGSCNGASSCTATNQIGDLQIAYAGRDGTTTQASTPAGWISVSSSNINGSGAADSVVTLFCRVATSANQASGTFTNATAVNISTYRGNLFTTNANCATALGTPVFTKTTVNMTSTTETFGSVTNAAATSWDVGFGYAPAATAGMNTAPTGMTNRNTLATTMGVHDTNAAVASYSTANVTITTASRIITVVVEVKVADQNVPWHGFADISGGTTNFVTTWTPVSGDLLGVAACWGNNASGGASMAITDNQGSGSWTNDTKTANGTVNACMFAYKQLATGGATFTVTGTITGTAPSNGDLFVFEITGRATSSPKDGSGAGSTGTSTSLTTTNVTITAADLLFSAFIDVAGSGSFSAGNGTLIDQNGVNQGTYLQYQSTSSTGAGTVTEGTASNWAARGIAFLPPSNANMPPAVF